MLLQELVLPHRSHFQCVTIPTDLTIYSLLFTHPKYSILHTIPPSILGSFISPLPNETIISFPLLRTLTTHLSTALVKFQNLRRGDVVAGFCKNSIWYPVVMWAVIRVGAVWCGGNPGATTGEMVESLKRSGANFVICDDGDVLRMARVACAAVAIDEGKVLVLEGEETPEGMAGVGHVGVRQLVKMGGEMGEESQVEELVLKKGESNEDVLGFLGFSSGTTGLPKAAMITHHNVIAQCLQMKAMCQPNNLDLILAVLPFYHITGLVHLLHLSVALNRTTVITPPPFSLEKLLHYSSLYRPTSIGVVPPIIQRILHSPSLTPTTPGISNLKTLSSGAAPLSKQIIEAWEKKFPNVELIQGYGMTESTGCVTLTPNQWFLTGAGRPWYLLRGKGGEQPVMVPPKGTVGLLAPNTQVMIMDVDTNTEIHHSQTQDGEPQPGEIHILGPQCIKQYLADPEATSSLYDSEMVFLRTGDMGYIDHQGWLFITGRLKEMVKVNGVAVAPAEVEDCLLSHPGVEDCAVTGVDDVRRGEVLRGFVVLKVQNGWKSRASEENIRKELELELVEWVRERKSSPKWLRGGVEFVDAIPKSPSGKVLRRVLQEKVRCEAKALVPSMEKKGLAKL